MKYLLKQTMMPLFLSSVLIPAVALAQHSAHQHGVAQMTMASEDEKLEVVLESAAANLLGFEYLPKSEADKAKVRTLKKQLQQANQLIGLPKAAECKLETTDIRSAQLAVIEKDHEGTVKQETKQYDAMCELDRRHKKPDTEKHSEHAHKHEDHEKHCEHKHEKHDEKHSGHKHEKHDDHEKHHDEKHSEHKHETEDTHNDIMVTWNFHCQTPDKLDHVNIHLFSTFEHGFETLTVDWLSGDKTGQQVLKKDTAITLK